MRTKPCWSESLGLEILYGWIVAAILLTGLVLLSECAIQPAHAGLYVDLAGGTTFFSPFSKTQTALADGVWWQEGVHPHSFDRSALAYRVGLGWQFNERWSIQGGYVSLGTSRVSSTFVDDPDYSIKNKACMSNCQATGNLTASSHYHGMELTVTHAWHFGNWSPQLTLGGAYLLSRFTVENYNQSFAQKHYSRMPATVIGGGLCWKQVCLEERYYHAFELGDFTTAIATDALVTLVSIRIPLS